MKRYLFFLLLPGSFLTARAQTSPVADSASFFLHKFAQNIGKETYRLEKSDGACTYTIHFKFVDRGAPVPLTAKLVTTPDYEPVSLFIKGNTSRFSTINDSIRIRDGQAAIRVDDSSYSRPLPPLSFPVGGYSPGTVQMILLQYWKRHQRPATIALLPTGSVTIRKDGNDTLSFSGHPLLLERYVISGLVWGNELVWTDLRGNLVCLITNDAEGDKLEMMMEPYESLLPELIGRAAIIGMQLFTASAGKPGGGTGDVLAIVGGRLIDVNGQSSIDHSVILIENGVIKKTGVAGSIPIPSKATVIHAEGKTILPGLWDMHAHFEQAEWGPAYLAAGVTTVRDCGNEFGYINAIQQAIDGGQGIGPHILKAGIIDGPGPMGLGIIRASTKEEAISAVQRYKDNGFVQIKIYSSVKPPIVKAICDEAHRLGLTVTGHIPEGMTLQQSVDSGMDMVNHMQYVYGMVKKNKNRSIDWNDPQTTAAIDFIQSHHVVIDPTIGVFEMIFRSVKDTITKMEPAFYTLPVPLQALFKNMGMPAAAAPLYKPMFTDMEKLVKVLHDKGVLLVAGTDMGFPGYSVDRELELYVEGGLTPLEAIQTATILPARAMKRDHISGSLEAGKQADLIIVDGDPLLQIRDIRKVTMVIKDGQVYDPAGLHRMAGFSTPGVL
jgi:imidazolonepropionase-like amidohydrolase